jgi:hypothetical protein
MCEQQGFSGETGDVEYKGYIGPIQSICNICRQCPSSIIIDVRCYSVVLTRIRASFSPVIAFMFGRRRRNAPETNLIETSTQSNAVRCEQFDLRTRNRQMVYGSPRFQVTALYPMCVVLLHLKSRTRDTPAALTSTDVERHPSVSWSPPRAQHNRAEPTV